MDQLTQIELNAGWRSCDNCGRPFIPPRSAQHKRFCCVRCRDQWHYAHRAKLKEAEMAVVESKEAAGYTDNGSAAEHCSICDHWRSRGTGNQGICRIVSGVIDAAGWCRHFIHVPEAAD